MRLSVFVFILLVTGTLSAQIQKDSSLFQNTGFRFSFHHGWMLPEYSFVANQSIQSINGFELSYDKVSGGSIFWHRLYHNPKTGIGLFHSGLSNPQLFGTQTALYFHTGTQIGKQTASLNFPWQLGLGLCYATKKYDAIDNPFNVVVGSHLNIYFRAAIGWKLFTVKNFGIAQYFTFHHLSNANMSAPNVGLNWLTFTNSITFYPKGKPSIANVAIPPVETGVRHQIILSAGLKHTRSFESYKYVAASLSYTALWKPSHVFSFGLGADLFYDSSVRDELESSNRTFLPRFFWHSGMHFEQRVTYNKTSFGLQEGLYMGFLEKVNNNKMYNRAFVQRHIGQNLIVRLSMKSHLHILDHVELGIGWTFSGRKESKP